MKTARRYPLPYRADSSALFAALRDLSAPVFLDSAAPDSERGRYDILAAKPIDRLVVDNPSPLNDLKTDSYTTKLNHFQELAQRLQQLEPLAPLADSPFCGGAIGYIGYDMGRELIALPSRQPAGSPLPAMAVGIYTWAIVVDHRRQRSALFAHPATSRGDIDEILDRVRQAAPEPEPDAALRGPLHTNMDHGEYLALFDRVQRYIHAGDCYQINLARRFSAEYRGSPWDLYRQLRRVAAAPFSAYLELDNAALLSLSPERFLELRGRRVRTEPIKGTAPRAADPARDRELAQALLHSDKNRAENLMIVDLLRNDLGRCCEPGSIRVDKLFELQSFNTVHHLVSTVSGQLRDGLGGLELMSACFPGGSITGAPKRRAMEIIEELEPHQRSAYCGSVFYLGVDGGMDSNIAIRSLACADGQLHCWSGGGIVADSDAEEEFEETWNKVGKLLEALR